MKYMFIRFCTRSGAGRKAWGGTAWTAAFALLIFLASPANGQNVRTVSGTVLDGEAGTGLPGVSVTIPGTTTGTATNVDGSYTLQVPASADSIRYSYIGYETLTVAIDGRSEITVELNPITITGSEVVVVGYTVQERRDLTGAVDVVDVENLTSVPTGEVTKALQGVASGVTVVSSGQPGEEPIINIRGFNTFGNNEPLYVVDGVPTQNIATLNPENIESLQVLKDAGAASIYGSRASNGVIIITTKQGSGGVTVSYDAYAGYQAPGQGSNPFNILTPLEMAQLKWMAMANSGTPITADNPDPLYGGGAQPRLPDYIMPTGVMEGDPAADPSNYYVIPHYNDPSMLGDFYRIVRANKEGTDWYNEVFRPAPMIKNDIAVSGGNEMGTFYFSLGQLNQQGTLKNTYLERYTLRANTSFNVNSRIRIGENLAYTLTENPTIGALSEGSAIGMSYRQQPIIPVYDIMGNYAGSFGSGLGNARNPVAIQDRISNNGGETKRLFGNIYGEIDLLKNLRLRTSFGGEIFSGFFHSFSYPEYENAENGTVNQYNESAYNGRNYTWNNTLLYTDTFADKHDLSVMVGTELYNNSGREVGGSTQGYFSFDPNYTNLDTGSGTQTNYSYTYGDGLFSLIGRLDYSFSGKYLLSATLRRDGSSRFLEHRYGWFPAVTAGWRISDESFLNDVAWLNDLKLRGGYGVMGNQLNVDPNNPYTLFVGTPTDSYYDLTGSNSNLALGFRQGRIGNPAARWERNVGINIGADFALFNNRLSGSIDYYEKNIEDLLYNPELPGTSGSASAPYVNVASMKNNGLDASLHGRVNLIGDLDLDAIATFTTYNNRIVAIAEGVDYFDLESRRFNGSNIIRNAVGQPISSYYGYNIVGFWNSEAEIEQANAGVPESNTSGVYQTGAGVGRFRYEDANGDGQITPDDRVFLGSPNPDFTYGLTIGLTYKNWDFSTLLYGVQGNEIWNQVKWWTDFYSSFQGAKSKTALYDSWTPENHNAKAPIQENEGSFSTNQVPNSYYVEDGSYLRVRNIQLGYTLPYKLLQPLGVHRLRLYVQAANVLTFTKYSGLDPEIGGAGATNFGIDEGAYSAPRQYLFGVNLLF